MRGADASILKGGGRNSISYEFYARHSNALDRERIRDLMAKHSSSHSAEQGSALSRDAKIKIAEHERSAGGMLLEPSSRLSGALGQDRKCAFEIRLGLRFLLRALGSY